MSQNDVDDYLQKGIFGAKELRPAERKKYLGTIKERIVVVLTNGQVMEDGVYPGIQPLMEQHPNTQMLLNGKLDYRYLACYIHLAQKMSIPFSIVTNEEADTNIGLVLTYSHAINKEDIYLTKEVEVKENKPKRESLLKRLFGSS